jgi:formylmethanofuran dehydrogenase subunit E
MKIRNYTESEAIDNDMQREDDLNQDCTHCPECGNPWFGNKDQLGDGHRVCCDCYQDWWVGIKYRKQAELRELPFSKKSKVK